MSRNRLLSHQSGNKLLHSTKTLNIYTTDLILEAMDKISALVLLDLSKAFDSICHEKLLQKLSAVGSSPAVVRWFRSYLSDRTQSGTSKKEQGGGGGVVGRSISKCGG